MTEKPIEDTNHQLRYGFSYVALRMLADTLDDIEVARFPAWIRVGAAERLTGDLLDQGRVIADGLQGLEDETEQKLVRAWRHHPLAPWAADLIGIGEASIARLVALTGDPALRPVGHWEGEGKKRRWIVDRYEPRTLGQLRAFCGHGDPERKLTAGMGQAELFALGAPLAKKRLYLISEACMKAKGTNGTARSPYRDVYDARRLQTADRVHAADCKRCGPSGHPAKTGTPWSDGHKHADALRVVGKTFLHDLWTQACRLQTNLETQPFDEAA